MQLAGQIINTAESKTFHVQNLMVLKTSHFRARPSDWAHERISLSEPQKMDVLHQQTNQMCSMSLLLLFLIGVSSLAY